MANQKLNVGVSFLISYLAWLRVTWHTKSRLADWGPRSLARLFAAPMPGLAWLLGIHTDGMVFDGVNEADLKALKSVVVTVSPHGVGVGHALLTGPALVAPPFDTLGLGGLAATAAFALPLWREWLMVLGWREATTGMADRLIEAQRSVLVLPGGVIEMTEADHRHEVLRIGNGLGFIRLALPPQ